ELVVEAGVLRHYADRSAYLPGGVRHVEAEHVDRAPVGSQQAAADVDGRGLAGPVGPQQAEDLAPAYRDVEVLERHQPAVGGPYAREGDGRIGHGWFIGRYRPDMNKWKPLSTPPRARFT